MNVDVIIFDLDDTLYDEINYVKSGFIAVSQYFSNHFQINQKEMFDLFVEELEQNGRGKVFDNVLKRYKIDSKAAIKKALSIYRTHTPQISLTKQTLEILEYFKHYPIYIVTDGNKIVQANKIKALGLEKLVKKVFITHRFGKKHSKPSTYCFEKIASLEQKNFNNIVYIGDNPNKDFVNIKKLGFQTIRIINGMFAKLKLSKDYEADIIIHDLDELKNILKKTKA